MPLKQRKEKEKQKAKRRKKEAWLLEKKIQRTVTHKNKKKTISGKKVNKNLCRIMLPYRVSSTYFTSSVDFVHLSKVSYKTKK